MAVTIETPDPNRRRENTTAAGAPEGQFDRGKLSARVGIPIPSSLGDSSSTVTTAEELAQTLQSFVRRVGMILQAEKCVIMLYDSTTGELVARAPAHRISEEELAEYRVPVTLGLAGKVFHEGRPFICHNCAADVLCVQENLSRFNVNDALTVPIMVERRNENQQVVESTTIGVIHVFNKRYGLRFTEEDCRLLTVLARNAAAIISTAQIFLAIANEKKQLEYTLLSMPSGLLSLSRTQQIQLINATAARLFNLQPGEGIGHPYQDVIKDQQICAFLTEAIAHNGELGREFYIGERCYQAQADIVRDERHNPVGLLCTFSDVTDLRNVERMKSDFVSTVSHELRTPLTAIKGFTRTLLDDPEGAFYDQQTRMEFYNIIDTECDRLIRLISDLLNVSRIERGLPLHMNYAEFSVPELLEKCLSFHRGYTNRHELIADVAPDLPRITADRDKLDQVLSNLISNAIKYSPEGGSIIASVAEVGDSLRFAVRDQGMGIPPEHLEKVFQRFHRVHSGDSRLVGGTGIGLFLTKSLVDAHRGKIWVESSLGQGSTFCFTIPKTPPAEV